MNANRQNLRLVHHARRLLEQRAAGNRFVDERTLDEVYVKMTAAYAQERNPYVAKRLHVELDRVGDAR